MNLVIENDLEAFGVETVGIDNRVFRAELRRHVGDQNFALAASLVNASQPFGLFVRNRSNEEIVAIALRWRFVNSKGESKTVTRAQLNPGVLMGIAPKDPALIGKTSLINVDTAAFFSYFDSVSSKIRTMFRQNRSGRITGRVGPDDALNEISASQSMLADVAEIVVSIDAVMFRDGTGIGKDESFLFESLNGLIQARKDFLRELRDANRTQRTDAKAVDAVISRISSNSSLDRSQQPATPTEAFEKAYRLSRSDLVREIEQKRTRTSDTAIINEFLAVKESDFVPLRIVQTEDENR